jgi:hypothetical protein
MSKKIEGKKKRGIKKKISISEMVRVHPHAQPQQRPVRALWPRVMARERVSVCSFCYSIQ